MYTKKQRSLALLICAAFLFVTFASLFYIVKEAHHDCVGKDCAICAAVAEAEDTLEALKNGACSVSAAFAAAVFFLLFLAAGTACAAFCATPVAQRVRMND